MCLTWKAEMRGVKTWQQFVRVHQTNLHFPHMPNSYRCWRPLENLYIVPVICHSSVERHRVFQTLMLNYRHRVAVFSWDIGTKVVCVWLIRWWSVVEISCAGWAPSSLLTVLRWPGAAEPQWPADHPCRGLRSQPRDWPPWAGRNSGWNSLMSKIGRPGFSPCVWPQPGRNCPPSWSQAPQAMGEFEVKFGVLLPLCFSFCLDLNHSNFGLVLVPHQNHNFNP